MEVSRYSLRSALPLLVALIAAAPWAARAQTHSSDNCDGGLTVPHGFCASVFADRIGHARHLTVSAGNVVYVNTREKRQDTDAPAGGFLVALQEVNGSGRASVQRFGVTPQEGGAGGTGIALYNGALYAEESDRIERYVLDAGSIVPLRRPQVVVSGLPLYGDHPMHPFVIDADGNLYVDVASATNSCQERNRQLRSPGIKPCTELETRGGIWRYDANKLNQKFSAAGRYATGIRNADGIAVAAGGHGIYATQHGRDQLHDSWPALYRPDEEATLPAEELLKVRQGEDFGWPECYFDELQNKLVLAPEYGGDGGKAVGVCKDKQAPIATFPAHWAPNDVVIYTGSVFPARYRGGAFIAFHGSWNRSPYPQGGYNVVYQPLNAGRDQCEVFADGFAGAVKEPGGAEHRPSGLAVGPDGALYVADDVRGRIYRIVYRGGQGDSTAGNGAGFRRCPPPDAAAGELAAPPAAAPATLPVPPGSSAPQVALGEEIYRGKVKEASCAGCHGADGAGSEQGPSLIGKSWLWSDGSYAGIRKTITEGVPHPKKFTEPMPPLGGAQLTAEEASAVAAYVWALGHR